MKRTVTITGIVLMLLLAYSTSLSAQYGMKGAMDSTRMIRMKARMDSMHVNRMGMRPESMRMHGMRQGMGAGNMYPGRQFMGHRNMNGMGRGMMAPGMRNGMGRGMRNMPMADMRIGGFDDRMGNGRGGPGRLMLESIPNVTEKQKKDIADLQKQQQDEMKKMREEMSAKMQAMRESNRKSILNILTDEQKKFLEAKDKSTTAVPEKTK